MSGSTHRLRPSPAAGALRGWWGSLNQDQQTLLRITASGGPLSPSVLDLLAWSGCPLASRRGERGPAAVHDVEELTAFIARV